FAPALMDRFGLRAVTVGALITVASGALLTTLMTSPWELYLLWGVVVGLGTGCMASVLAATVAGRWFVHRRGLVLGALTAAGATGQLIFLPGLGYLAQYQGWRWAAITVGVAALAVVPIVALFLRNRPSDLGLRAYGATEADSAPLTTGSPIRNAFGGLRLGVRSRDFSLLLLPYVFGSAQFGLILFIVFYGLDWVATVPPTVQLARRAFGQQNFAIVYGWIFAAHQLGAASIAFAAGAVRTFFGDYQLAFMSSGLLCLIAAGLVLRIVRTRRTEGPGLPIPAEAPAYT